MLKKLVELLEKLYDHNDVDFIFRTFYSAKPFKRLSMEQLLKLVAEVGVNSGSGRREAYKALKNIFEAKVDKYYSQEALIAFLIDVSREHKHNTASQYLAFLHDSHPIAAVSKFAIAPSEEAIRILLKQSRGEILSDKEQRDLKSVPEFTEDLYKKLRDLDESVQRSALPEVLIMWGNASDYLREHLHTDVRNAATRMVANAWACLGGILILIYGIVDGDGLKGWLLVSFFILVVFGLPLTLFWGAYAMVCRDKFRRYKRLQILLNTGCTDLMLAAYKGDTQEIAALVAAGAEVNAKDNYGETALMKAKNTESIMALIAAGADITAKNNEGKTALDLVQSKDNPNLSFVDALNSGRKHQI